MANTSIYDIVHPAMSRWAQGSTDNGMTEKWTDILSKDPTGKHIVMTMEIVMGGDTIVRVATQPIEVTSSVTQKKYSYLPILMDEPSISKSMTVGNAGSVVRSINIQIPNQLVDVKSTIANGYPIAGIGEISLQVDGGDYEDRYVLIRGSTDDGASFGAQEGEFIQMSVADPKATADLKLAPYEVDVERWNLPHESAIGNRYPVILNSFSRVPALLCHYDSTKSPVESRWLVCCGITANISATSAVYVNGSNTNVGSGLAYGYEVKRYADGKGTGVTLVDMTAGVGGGLASPDPDAAIFVEVTRTEGKESLVSALTYLLERYTALSAEGINYRLLGKSEAALGGLKVSGCINGSSGSSGTNTMQYIEGQLLSSFPMVSMVWSNGKYGPVVTDRRNGYTAASLSVGQYPLFDRISDVQESPKSACLNSFTLRYAYDALENNYTKSITLDYTNSALCQLSQTQAGMRVDSPIDSLVIKDDDVAAYVVSWMVDHLSLPSYYVEYQGAVWMYFNLDVGDNIKLTDEEFGWDAETATVEKLEYKRGLCTIGLRVWWRYSDLSGAASTIFAFGTPTPREIVEPSQ